MRYCGEVNEDDWCQFHACMKNMCRWQHLETFEQMRARVDKARLAQRTRRESSY